MNLEHAEGGDLGTGDSTYSNEMSFLAAVETASLIFKEIDRLELTKKNLKYGIALVKQHDTNVGGIAVYLKSFDNLYSVDGRNLFELRGPSGGISAKLICYVTTSYKRDN